jgi:uncharacterized membrane protein HdeD (DUF308 family)
MVESDPQKLLAKYGITGQAAAILMIVFGVLIIVVRDLLWLLIGFYLIIVGLINLIGHLNTGSSQEQTRPPMATPVKRGSGSQKRQWHKVKIK